MTTQLHVARSAFFKAFDLNDDIMVTMGVNKTKPGKSALKVTQWSNLAACCLFGYIDGNTLDPHQTNSPTHPIAAAEKTPIKKRSKMINSTFSDLNANIIHIMKEQKLDITIIVRFPRYCDIQPPTKNPMIHPRDRAAPKVISFQKKALTLVLINIIPIHEMSTSVISIFW